MPSFSRISAALMPSQVEGHYQNTVAANVRLIVLRDDLPRPGDGGLGVVGEACVHFG